MTAPAVQARPVATEAQTPGTAAWCISTPGCIEWVVGYTHSQQAAWYHAVAVNLWVSHLPKEKPKEKPKAPTVAPSSSHRSSGTARRSGGSSEYVASRSGTNWDAIARCESGGDWNYGGPGGHTDPGYAEFEGGLNFTNSTWNANKPPGAPAHAYQASKAQQIAAAESTKRTQGIGAWPVCGRNG